MALTTYSTFKTKVFKDLDLEDEEFVQAAEFLGYTNEGLREAASEVMGINDDYFLTKAYLPLVQGTSVYTLPTGIYNAKIRAIIYDQGNAGTLVYEIKRFRDSKKFFNRSIVRSSNITDYYKYIIYNTVGVGPQLELSPASNETSSTNVTIFYIRTVTPIALDADYVDMDIPECLNFLYAYVKAKCKQKENAGVMPADAWEEVQYQKKLMVETLTPMVADDDNKVEMDLNFYEDMS